MSKKRFRRRHRGFAGGTPPAAKGGDGAAAEAPRPATGVQPSVPLRVVPGTKPAPPPQPSEEGRKGEVDVVEASNGEQNGHSATPVVSAGDPGLVTKKIDFGESEIVVYRRVEKKSCSRYMLKDMFD